MIVRKQTFELPSFTTVGGRTIRDVRIGWECYGKLNAERSNAILVTHHFSGTSHAAGRYADADEAPGYWDALIGSGKALDTDRYCVIAADTLVNLNARDPRVVTTGPASVDPSTGRRYGLGFPLVTIADFVDVQKALLDSLGIRRLHAVMGASMGGLQAYAWASRYPERVARIVPVVSAGTVGPWLIAWLDIWAAPIRLDPRWAGGAYDERSPPTEGLEQSLKIIALQANHWRWADAAFDRAWAAPDRDPGLSLADSYRFDAALSAGAKARAAVADANHLLYLVRANQTFSVDLDRIRAKTLILYSPTDQVFPAEAVEATAVRIAAAGAAVDREPIIGPHGHYDGIVGLAPLAQRIAAFLAG